MRLLALVGLPLLGAGAAAAGPRQVRRGRTAILITTAAVHLAVVASLWVIPPADALGGWVGLDALGLVVLTLTSVLFLVTALYVVGYLARESPRGGRVFVSCLLGFLAAMSMVAVSQHLAMLWVGMDATTLTVAPLIFHRRDRRSLEAVWKYLVITSVGIALALFGIFLLSTAQAGVPGRSLVLSDLVRHAGELNGSWLRAAFLFLVIGFGTKMGLAPLHTWKPDTYGEAPSLVSGLMAGALTSCAFLGVARVTAVAMAAGLGHFVQPLLMGFGLVSLVVAAAFMLIQRDVKRLLAYSSVEHMGLLVLGLGLGGIGAYGAVLHLLNNGLVKAWLFLVVGNIVLATGSSAVGANRGLVRTLPLSGVLLVLGLFAVTGSPPFGLFLSEFTIVRAAVAADQIWVAAVMLLLLVVIFVAMATLVLEMAFGEGDPEVEPTRESGWLLVGPVTLAALVLMLGVYLPQPLQATISQAAVALGGSGP